MTQQQLLIVCGVLLIIGGHTGIGLFLILMAYL